MNMTIPLKRTVVDNRRSQIAIFFRNHRLEAGLSAEVVARDLGLESAALLLAYENGAEAIPLDEVFGLTNLLNIAPEDVLELIYDVHAQGMN